MLKRLKRLWFGNKATPDDEVVDDDLTPEPAIEQAPDVEDIDPMRAVIADFDRLVADIGAPAAMPALRELLLESTADARLLARSADLLREIDDPELAEMFDAAARSRRAAPFVALSVAFQGLGDHDFAIALSSAALDFEPDDGDALVAHTNALAALGEHTEVLETVGEAMDELAPDSDLGAVLAARFATSALMLGDLGRFAEVEHRLADVAPWLLAAGERVRRYGGEPLASTREARQRAMFNLYGTVLLDEVDAGETLSPARLATWVNAVVALVGPQGSWEAPTLEVTAAIRPTWIGPRGEVLARWIAALLPDGPNPIPLTSRIPGQRILIVIADDAELAQLWEMKAFFDGPAPVFQAIKDPAEIDSPMADIIGAFGADVAFPFEALDAERLAERMVPRSLAQHLQSEVGVLDHASLERFASWAAERRGFLMCDVALEPDERPRLLADGL